MSASAGKFVNNFSVNKGVEAREFQLDAAAGNATKDKNEARSENSASYVQVVVHKKRLPTASSPPPHGFVAPHTAPAHASAGGDAEASAVLLTCPALAALQRCSWRNAEAVGNKEKHHVVEDHKRKKVMGKVNSFKPRALCSGEADRVEVYRFERSDELICAQRGVQRSRVEHWVYYWAEPAAVLMGEALGALRVVVSTPVNVLLQLERCAAESAWHVTGGAVTVLSDVLFKPALALVFNALVRPPLLCMRVTAEALREAVRPAAMLLGDILEAAARPIAALRLVHMERCECMCHAHPRHVATV